MRSERGRGARTFGTSEVAATPRLGQARAQAPQGGPEGGLESRRRAHWPFGRRQALHWHSYSASQWEGTNSVHTCRPTSPPKRRDALRLEAPNRQHVRHEHSRLLVALMGVPCGDAAAAPNDERHTPCRPVRSEWTFSSACRPGLATHWLRYQPRRENPLRAACDELGRGLVRGEPGERAWPV